MPLTPGTRLGVFELADLLGRGGMGEVYRATDTKLKRQVAIKVLPPSMVADRDRLARFQREAEVLASLNHPNIAGIYGLEESDGITALVMELVEGEDLSQRIARSAIPIDEALPIAKQIAEALEAAHEQGIVHRDLKPANIKLRADGTVKVLDFGLAKAMDPAAASSATADAMNSPTLSLHATQAGMILGTAAYMSPEQARGTTVDKRADLWAFGVVLWEMLTKRRLFEGATVPDTLASLLKTEPDWTALPGDTPAPIRRLLRRCLDKDRKRRLDSAAAARLEIDEALTATAGERAQASTRSRAASSRGLQVALAVAALVCTALAIPAVRFLRETPTPALQETRTDIVTPATAEPFAFALSPDGRRIVFAAAGDGAARLWLRSLAKEAASPLTGTEGGQFPFWSPDSRAIGFFADGRLKWLDPEGGAPHTVAAASSGRGASWNADGVILFTPDAFAPVFRVPASGGTPVAVTKLLDRQSSHRFPSFLPDGRHFLFYVQGTPDNSGIYLGTLGSTDMHRLTEADAAGVYLPSGWLLWVGAGPLVGQFLSAGMLVAQRLDMDQQALVGDRVTLADPVVFESGFNIAAVSASANGLVAYRTAEPNRRQLVWFDRSGKVLGPMGAPDENNLSSVSLSPDGHEVAVSRTLQSNTDIWLMDNNRTRRFTFDAAAEIGPVWSPDGGRVAFQSTRNDRRDLYERSSSGAGADNLLFASPRGKTATDWSADGRFLLYQSDERPVGWHLWVLPLEGDRSPWALLNTAFDERLGAFSPDGRWVAYQSNESGRMEIYVKAFSGSNPSSTDANMADGRWQVSTAGGIVPRWRRNGRELYYLGPSGAMMAASIRVTGSTLTSGAPVALFTTQILGGGIYGGGRQYDVATDGRFLVNTVLDNVTAPITLLQNWNPEGKK